MTTATSHADETIYAHIQLFKTKKIENTALIKSDNGISEGVVWGLVKM